MKVLFEDEAEAEDETSPRYTEMQKAAHAQYRQLHMPQTYLPQEGHS